MTPKSVITAKQDFRFSHKQRVRAAEVDAHRVVLHAHFQKYFDTAATEYWRSLSLPYAQTMAQLGGELRANPRFCQPSESAPDPGAG